MRKFTRNLIYAFAAQITSTILSILISLFLPKFLGKEEFAYWQLFVFYSGYVGFFHFGLSDGIYLKYGGTKLEDMKKELIGSQLRLMMLWQVIICVTALAVIPFYIRNEDRVFVWTLTAVYLLTANATWFLGYVFQAANETKYYSTGVIISKVVFIVLLSICLFLRIYNFRLYIVFYVLSQIVALVYSAFKGKAFITAKGTALSIAVKETLSDMKTGINLTFANIASSLILGLGRGFVDYHWDIEHFSFFSLSISLVNFILQFITQISMVMFPALRQMKEKNRNIVYDYLRNTAGILFCGVMIFYAPIRMILSWWIPEYSESLYYLSAMLPICVFDGKMQMLYSTYMKVMRKEKSLMLINAVSCASSLIFCIVFTAFFDNVIMPVFAMITAIALRSIISSIYISKVMNISIEKNLVFELFLSFLFVLLNNLLSLETAFIIYLFAYLLVLWINRRKLKKAYTALIKNQKP